MNPIDILLNIINNARKIIDFSEKASVDTSTENYFLPIQRTGNEVERIGLNNLPVSQPVTDFVNSIFNNLSTSRRLRFTVTSATQSTFAIGEPFVSADVVIDRVAIIEGVDYSISGTNVVLTNPAVNGSILDIRIYTSNDPAITQKDIFTATAGQTAFDLGRSFTSVDVTLNTAVQIEGTDFTVSGNIVTFSSGLNAGDVVQIRTFGE